MDSENVFVEMFIIVACVEAEMEKIWWKLCTNFIRASNVLGCYNFVATPFVAAVADQRRAIDSINR